MGGITSHYEPGEAAIRAILAGSDQILLSTDTDAAVEGRPRRREVGPDLRGAHRRERQAHPRRQEAPEPLRQGRPVRREDREDRRHAARTRRSRPRSRAARMTLVREKAGALPFRKDAKLLSLVVADEPTLNGPAGRPRQRRSRRASPAVKTRAPRHALDARGGEGRRRGREGRRRRPRVALREGALRARARSPSPTRRSP